MPENEEAAVDHADFPRKGFPLLIGAFAYWSLAGFSLLFYYVEHDPSWLWPMAMSLVPGVLLFVMSFPRIYRREASFRNLRVVHRVIYGAYCLVLVGKFASRAVADFRQGNWAAAILLGALLIIGPPLIYLARRAIKKAEPTSSLWWSSCDKHSADQAGLAFWGCVVICLVSRN